MVLPLLLMKLLGSLLFVAAGLTVWAGCSASSDPEEDTALGAADLKTKDHRNISKSACSAQNLPDAFCRRVGSEAFDVDSREWTDLAAHAQPSAGQSQCQAATEVAGRLASLGKDIHEALATRDPGQAERIASSLGRALHTIEDNCAHHGMSNPQHAWYSREFQCHSEIDPIIFGDPDEQPEAKACAATEANAVMTAFAKAARAAHYPVDQLGGLARLDEENPSLHQACEFIREADGWDGRDATWNNASTVPSFRKTLADAMSKGTGAGNVCSSLKNPHPFPAKGRPPPPNCFVCGG